MEIRDGLPLDERRRRDEEVTSGEHVESDVDANFAKRLGNP
jgi:hypothetical protein